MDYNSRKQERDGRPPRGRPTKLTEEMLRTLEVGFRLGLSSRQVSSYAGIDETTLSRWLKQGEKARSGIHRRLWILAFRGDSDLIVDAMANIVRSMPRSWRACAYLVDRSDRISQLNSGSGKRRDQTTKESRFEENEAIKLARAEEAATGINIFDMNSVNEAILSGRRDVPSLNQLRDRIISGELRGDERFRRQLIQAERARLEFLAQQENRPRKPR